MSKLLSKEQQSPYQRWELNSFGDKRIGQVEQEALRVRLTEADLAAQKERAYRDAYKIAYQEAYEIAYKEGHQKAYDEMQNQAMQIFAQIEDLSLSFCQQLNQVHQSVGTELSLLASEIAASMSKALFTLHPEIIAKVVDDAIASLPLVTQPAYLFLHPADAALITEISGNRLEKIGMRILVDAQLERGGCRIETAHHLVDASYRTRWQQVTNELIASEKSEATSPNDPHAN